MKRILCLLLPAALACRPPASGPVRLAPGVSFTLCEPALGPDFHAVQEAVFELPGGRTETALAALENGGGRFSVVASAPFGQTLFTVVVKGRQAQVDTRIPLPRDFDPRMLPALVQLSLWPAPALREALGPGLELVEEGRTRRLVKGSRVLWSVTHEGDRLPFPKVLVENPSMRIRIHIRTLDE